MIKLRFVKKTCSTHSPEAIHVFTFHLYYACCENFGHEHWRKIRSEIGDEEILPRFLELGQVFYILEIVVWCSTLFMLWVLAKNQGIRSLYFERRGARLTMLKVEDDWLGLGLSQSCCLHPFFSICTPLAHYVKYLSFLLLFFGSDFIFFAQA